MTIKEHISDCAVLQTNHWQISAEGVGIAPKMLCAFCSLRDLHDRCLDGVGAVGDNIRRFLPRHVARRQTYGKTRLVPGAYVFLVQEDAFFENLFARSSEANLGLFCHRRHRVVRATVHQPQRNFIRTRPTYLQMSAHKFGSVGQSRLKQDTADRWRKVPSNAS
ncbi:MAG: hypothetical protein GY820_31940 [Gammaproteobacteria bacterium]|nr:hypothetical protein [Gammaproteobacteria bacterium]